MRGLLRTKLGLVVKSFLRTETIQTIFATLMTNCFVREKENFFHTCPPSVNGPLRSACLTLMKNGLKLEHIGSGSYYDAFIEYMREDV